MNGKKKGFTLIELLVVVLIIGILAAIALPQYQKAVLKSRYTTLMPIAKGIAEGNEAYFMEHGTYAEDPTELPIKGQESYPDGTELRVVDDTDKDVSYVIATRPKLMPNNKYIVFQKHSGKFSDVTLCEATADPLATWLCKDALKGKVVEGNSLSGTGWTGYALSGNTTGSSFASALEQVADNLIAQNSNYAIASVDEENGKVTLCDTSMATVTEDGKCKANNTTTCNVTAGGYSVSCDTPYEVVYDEEGELLSRYECVSYSSEGCTSGNIHTYDESGHSSKSISCYGSSITESGLCSAGKPSNVNDVAYDPHNNITSTRVCYPSSNTTQCDSYSHGYEYTNSYDTNNQLSFVACSCGSYSGTTCAGSCYNEAARKPLYDGNIYTGYRSIQYWPGSYHFQDYDVAGNPIGESFECESVDWENATCL